MKNNQVEKLNIPSTSWRYAILGLMILHILLHVPMMGLPPVGQHAWRQTVGHAAAQNYAKEDMRFLYPRADIRMFTGDNGTIYHELPITSWLAAAANRSLGIPIDLSLHWWQLTFNLLGIVGAFALMRALKFSEVQSFFFTFLFTCSPLYFYYAPLLEPNMLGLSFFLLGCGFFIERWQKRLFDSKFWLGAALITVGTLAKPTFLFFGLPLAIFVGRDLIGEKSPKLLKPVIGTGVMVAMANAFFIGHAAKLYQQAPIERAVHTPIGPAMHIPTWQEFWRNVEAAATTWFIEMNINLAALPLFLFGAYLLLRHQVQRNQQGRIFWLGWTLSFAIFSIFFLSRYGDHDYYITPTLPLAALISSYGAARLWEIRRGRIALAVLAPIIIVVAVLRGYGRWYKFPQVPETLRTKAEDIAKVIPKDDLVLVQGDSTPIVFLYYLQRKGFSIETEDRDLHEINLQDFHWLVRYDKGNFRHPEVDTMFQKDFVTAVDDFSVYRIERR